MVGSRLLAFGLLAVTGLSSALIPPRDIEIASRFESSALAKCPGYKASRVKTSATGLTAELTLAGKACNVYGTDLKDLILQVTYETGT